MEEEYVFEEKKRTFFQGNFLDILGPFSPTLRPHFENSYPLFFFVLFSIESSTLSIKMRKLHVKLRNASIYPP